MWLQTTCTCFSDQMCGSQAAKNWCVTILNISCLWHRTVTSRSQPRSLQSASKTDNTCSLTSSDSTQTHLDTHAEASAAEGEITVLDRSQCPEGDVLVNQRRLLEKDRGRAGWWWAVGDRCHTAQWVKQKQEYRSTRPWWPQAGSVMMPNSDFFSMLQKQI